MTATIERPAPHPDLMYQREGQIEHWYQTHDGLPVTLMQRSLAEHALERINELTYTVATMRAEDKPLDEIGAMVVAFAEAWQEQHIEALTNCGK